jgi:hypothetical protein
MRRLRFLKLLQFATSSGQLHAERLPETTGPQRPIPAVRHDFLSRVLHTGHEFRGRAVELNHQYQ